MKVYFILLFLFVNTCLGQSSFLEVDLKDIQSKWSIKDAYLIKDEQTDDYYVMLEEYKVTYGFKFDKTKGFTKRVTSEGLKMKYKEIIGHLVKDDKLILIQKNNKGNKFAYIQYDFTTGKTSEAEYDLEKRSDRFVESYCTSGMCIMYTININDDSLKKWQFNMDGSLSVEEIPLASQFRSNGIENKNLGSYIIKPDGLSSKIELVKVNNKVPNNIEIATNPNKMYEQDNGFIWTLDDDMEHTILIYFNYPDFKPKLKLIKKSKLEKGKGASNSFLFEDKIAQVLSNNKQLVVDIKSIEQPAILFKTLNIEKQEQIDFKNSPILQEGSVYSFERTRKMEKTSKLLRKMSSQDNGISVHRNNDKYHITIGGTRERSQGAPMMMPGFGAMPIGQFGAMTLSYNPTFYAYGVYSSTDSTRIECLFDEEFNHVEGEIEKNVFDRIDDFKDVNGMVIKVEGITFLDDKVIFGYLNKKTDQYVFKSFDL